MRVAVEPYNPGWAADFEAVERDLATLLAAVSVDSIEHVGSTSVPGLAAKPILDIDVIVPEDVVPAAIAALENGGYRYEGELGVTGRHAFAAPDDGMSRHVYVCVRNCLAVRNHVAVRDTLRQDTALRDEYGTLKLSLAEREFENMDEYGAAKNDVLQKILDRAGLSASDRRAILAANARPRLA